MEKEDSKIKSGQAHISVQITIVNGTPFNLEFTGSQMEGQWNGGPVQTVNPNTIMVVGQDDSTSGVLGVEGYMKYNIMSGGALLGNITVNWDNPNSGSPSYSCSASPNFYINYNGSGGSNSGVTYILCQASWS